MWAVITLAVLAGICLLALLFSLYLFRFLFYKPKRSTKIPDFYKDSPHYKVSRAGMAYMKTRPCEDVYMTSRDGLRLHAYLFPADGEPKKFVVGIHGYRSYARPEFGPYIEFYHSLGYSLLLPDDRAHRPSEGTYIGFGVLDRLDCVDWVKYVRERFGDDTDVLLHGVSMGAATVLAASGEEDLPPIRGVVADCGYTGAWDILSHQLAHRLPRWPFLNLCEKICKQKAGFSFHEYTPLQQVQHAKAPILFVHGEKDQMVPCHMVHELYEACSSEKRLLVVPEAGHGESIAFAPDEYHKAILELFHIA